MAAKRRRHNRSRRAKGRFRALYQMLAVLIVVGVAAAGCVVFFRVEVITVTGNSRYTTAEVVAASGVENGDYLVTLNINRIVNQILSDLPYVESVSAHWSLPDTVLITVQESEAVAVVRSGESWWLMNSAGKLLETVPDAGECGVIIGLEPVSPTLGSLAEVSEEDTIRWGYALNLLQVLEEHDMIPYFVSLDCSTAGTFIVQYGDRFTLLLPTTGDFNIYLSMLEGALAELGEGESGVFDFTLYDSTGRVYFRHEQ